MRVAVRQVDDQADYYLIIFQVIEEGAAGVFASNDIQWPAGGVYHQALFVLGWVDVPDFLDADAVMLGVGFGVEAEFLDQLLADMATAAFGEQRVLGAQFHAWGVVTLFRVTFAVDTQITSENAVDRAFFVDQRFLSGEAWVDFYAEVFRLLRQPAAQVAKGNDVVAMVVHGLGYEEVRNLGGFLGILENVNVITLDWSIQRGAELFPVWEQFIQCARLEHRA